MNSAISVPVLLLDCAAVDHRCVPRLVQQDTLFPYLPLTVCLASTPDKAPPNATKAPPTATAATTTTATSKLLRYRQELRLDGDSKLPFISTVVASRELRAVRRVIVSSGVSYQKLVSVVAPAIAAGVDLPLDSVEAPWPLPMLPATKVTVNKRDSMVNGKADDAAWTAALSMTTELDLGQCTVDHGPRICALASRLTSLSFEAHPTEATKIIDCFFQLPAPRPALRELESYLWSSTPTLLPLPVDHVGHLRRLHLSAWPVEGIVAFIAANASTLEDLVINFDPFRVQESDAPDYSPLLTVPTALPRLRRLYVQGTMSGKVQSMLSAAVSQPLERLETHDVDWASPLRVNISELVSICPAFFAHPRPPYMFMETMYQNDFTSPIPFAPPQLKRSIRGINPMNAKALEPGDVPAVDAFFANRLANSSVVDLRHAGVQAAMNKSFGSAAKWSDVRYFYDKGDWFYSLASTALFNSSQQFVGYCLAAVEVIDIGKELDSVRPTAATNMFIIDRSGYIMGATAGANVYNKTTLVNKTAPIPPGCTTTEQSKTAVPSTQDVIMCRHHAADSTNVVLRALSGENGLGSDGLQKVVTVDGKSYYVRVDALKSVTLEATVVVVVPESDIIGDVQRTVMIAALSTAAVVVVAAVMSFFFVWAMLHPLVSIAVRMGKAARLEEDDEEVGDSAMAEIGHLQRAFVEMRDELSRIRAFVPQSLLKAGLSDMDTDDNSSAGTYAAETTSGLSRDAGHPSAGVRSTASEQTVISVVSAVSDGAGPPRVTPRGTPKSTGAISRKQSSGAMLNNDVTMATVGLRRKRSKPMMAARSAVGVRKEHVSLLVVNLRGYHRHTAGYVDPDAIAKLVDAVMSSVESEKSPWNESRTFHGDRFFVSFNAVRSAANHGVRAAVAAMRVSSAVEKLTDLSLPVSCGVSTGTAQVGNLGSATVKRFTIVGPVVSQAAALERMCKVFTDVSCLVPQCLIEDARTSVELHPVDYVQLPFMKTPCLIAAVVKEIKRNDDEDMEWMYQLQSPGGGLGSNASTPSQPKPIADEVIDGNGSDDTNANAHLKLTLMAFAESMRGSSILFLQNITAEDVSRFRRMAGSGWSALVHDDSAAASAALKKVMILASRMNDLSAIPHEIERFVTAAQAVLGRPCHRPRPGASPTPLAGVFTTVVEARPLQPSAFGLFYDRAMQGSQ